MIIEPERSGKTVSDVCIAFGVSRATWYKWKRRYDTYGIDGLKNQSRKPHNIKNLKVTEELEKLVLELRLNNRFGNENKVQIKEKVRSRLAQKPFRSSKETQAQCPVCQTKKKIQTL